MRGTMQRALRIWILAVLTTGLAAQQTWIVDQGGGGNFTDLAPAFTAAAPGDIVRIRGGGSFNSSYTLNKPLVLVADAPRPRVYMLTVAASPVAGTAVIADLYLAGLGSSAGSMPIAGENLIVDSLGLGNAVLSMHRCTLGSTRPLGDVGLSSTTAVLSDCTIRGPSGYCDFFNGGIYGAGPGLLFTGSNLQLANCVIQGGNGAVLSCGLAGAAPALTLWGGSVQLTRCSVSGGTLPGGGTAAAVLLGFGAVVAADASVQFSGGIFGGAVTAITLPATTGQGAQPGATMSVRLDGPAQLPALLAASFGLRSPSALPFGLVWIDPGAAVILASGSTSATGSLGVTIPVPATAVSGWTLTFQGAILAANAITAATPAVLLVH